MNIRYNLGGMPTFLVPTRALMNVNIDGLSTSVQQVILPTLIFF